MCCFNGEKHLRESIESILGQTHTDWELIFWDNQSTDLSASIVKEYQDPRIKYHLAPVHTNLGGGRAKSWPLLTGKFIAFLDVDDTWEPDRLELQIPLFNDPEVSIVAGNVLWKNDKHEELIYSKWYPQEGYVTQNLLYHYFLSLPSVTLRRSAVEKLEKAFDPEFSHISDFDLFVRVSAAGKLAIVKKKIANWRVDMNSLSWAQRTKFYSEHIDWIECYKHTNWFRPYRKALPSMLLSTIARKLYFAIIKNEYKHSESTGFMKFADRAAFCAFQILKLRPLRWLVELHFKTKTQKWV
jgi:glycosyltransferase involved in cell wall biosynthesis